MSYILDALRKAEQDRKRGEVPGIEDLQEVRSPEKKPIKQWGWVALAVFNVLLLALLFWPESKETIGVAPVARVEQPAVHEPPMPVQQRPKPPITRDKASIAMPSVSAATEVGIVYPQKAEETEWMEIDDRPLQPIPPPLKAVESKVSRQVAVKKAVKNTESPGKVRFLKEQETMQPVDTYEAPEPAQPAPAQKEEGLPTWPQVPSSVFSQLQGNLRMDVHVYANLPEDRFVLINLTKYREGEEMREGPYVEEINALGVILEFSGERFLLPAN